MTTTVARCGTPPILSGSTLLPSRGGVGVFFWESVRGRWEEAGVTHLCPPTQLRLLPHLPRLSVGVLGWSHAQKALGAAAKPWMHCFALAAVICWQGSSWGPGSCSRCCAAGSSLCPGSSRPGRLAPAGGWAYGSLFCTHCGGGHRERQREINKEGKKERERGRDTDGHQIVLSEAY